MRAYRDKWNSDAKRTTKLPSALAARSHGVGSISVDAHGPTFSERGDYANIPESVLDGLRDAGDSDTLVSRIRHRGWFTDEDGGTIYHGHVWQLPARDGEPVYIAGYLERENDKSTSGYAVLDCSGGQVETFDDAEDAARAGDALAERMAERERDYQMGWREASNLSDRCDELRTDAHAIRKDARNAAMVYKALPLSASAAREFTLAKFQEKREAFADKLAELIAAKDEFNAHPMRGDV